MGACLKSTPQSVAESAAHNLYVAQRPKLLESGSHLQEDWPMNKAERSPRFKPIPKFDATPEELARRIFAAVKPPDPSLCKRRKVGDRKTKR